MVERLDEEVKSDSVKDAALVSLQGRITGPTRRSTQGGWTEEEDKFLVAAVAKYNQRNWRRVAQCVPGRTYDQCLHRWQKVLDPVLVKGPWKKEEDDLIIKLVEQQGNNKKWSEVAKHVPGRIGKQCRERWHNHLNPDINRTPWTKEEEQILIKVHAIYGNKWAEIAKYLDRRTENSIKNHWNCSMRKKLESLSARDLLQQNSIVKAGRMNLDSVTHISRNIALGVHSTTMAQPIEPTSDKGNFQFPSREAIFGKTENRTPAAACPSDVECRERTHVLSNSLDDLQSATPSVPLTLSLCTPSVPKIKRLQVIATMTKSPTTVAANNFPSEKIASTSTTTTISLNNPPPESVGYITEFFSDTTIPDTSLSYSFYSHFISHILKPDLVQRGRVSCTTTVLPSVINSYIGLHGGAVAAIAERVAIACARTVVAEDKEIFLGELSMSYLSAAQQNEVLVVDGSVVRSGRNLTVVAMEFKIKETQKPVYLARATFYHMPVAKL